MSDAVFRVAADVAEFVSGMTRADAATKKVARSAGSIGDAVGASIVKIELLNRALNAAGRAISGVMDKATSASATAGDRAIGLATSLGSLGVRDINAMTKKLMSGSGIATSDQNAQFAKSLVDVNKQLRQKLPESEVNKALEAYSRYGELGFGAGGEDLLSGISSGRSIDDIMKANAAKFQNIKNAALDPLSPLFQGLKGRFAENEATAVRENAFLVSGTAERAQRAAAGITASRDPGGPVSIIQGALGDTAATIANRALSGAAGGEDASARATEKAAAGIAELNNKFQRIVTAPTFATETR